MKYFILFSILISIIFTPFISSQTPDTLWTKKYGGSWDENGRSVQQTLDGGYIIVADNYETGYNDAWLIRTDENGNLIWDKTFGGSDHDAGYSVQQTSDGGFIITGTANSYNAGDAQAWLIKTDENGYETWNKTFGGNNSDEGRFGQQTLDGGYIIIGSTQSFGGGMPGMPDVWLIKTDENGDTLWTKTFGGSNVDAGISGQQTLDGGYIIAGVTRSFGTNDNVWLIKTDENGNELWNNTFGIGVAYSVQQTDDGGYIIAGGNSGRLIKTDEYGNETWNNTYGAVWFNSVQQTYDGGYIVAGGADVTAGNNDLLIIKSDESGNEVWTKTFGGYDREEGTCVQQNLDGSYIITGYIDVDNNSPQNNDVWLIKLGPDLPTDIKRVTNLVNNYYLQQNYPNPFNPITIIRYQIPEFSFVTLKVYDVLGNDVTTLVYEERPIGSYEVEFDASDLPSGIYFYKLQAGDFVETKKMILLK